MNLGVRQDSEQRARREKNYESNISTVITSDHSLRNLGVAGQSQSLNITSYHSLRTVGVEGQWQSLNLTSYNSLRTMGVGGQSQNLNCSLLRIKDLIRQSSVSFYYCLKKTIAIEPYHHFAFFEASHCNT